MNLVLGKFTPEHFSRFSKKFGSVEVELKSYLTWNSRDRLKFRTWIEKKEIGVVPRLTLRTSRSCEEFQDLFSAAKDEFQGRLRFFSISSGRKRFDSGQDERSHREFRAAVESRGAGLWFEWGEEDHPLSTAWIHAAYPEAGMLIDLDTHWKYNAKAGPLLHFKLHGWHPERWMRRYGETLIGKYRKRMELHPDSLLILAHSGRIEEAPEFG
jgi:hypothetical protein